MAIRLKLVDKLKAENTALKAEVGQLRDAARQLMEGLSRYAKEESWQTEQQHTDDETMKCTVWIWKGDGDGPKTAKYFLGLEEEKN